ncbi:MAG: C39 family peptidase [Lentisphaeraceae bacterium]|nr:C39 family peptidase [Lentisphaeraceae bacterium]
MSLSSYRLLIVLFYVCFELNLVGQELQPKNNKLPFELDTFLVPSLYSLDFKQLSEKLSRELKLKNNYCYESSREKNKLFPTLFDWYIKFNPSGIKHLSINFLKKKASPEEISKTAEEILNTLNLKYGKFIASDKPDPLSTHYYWKPQKGFVLMLDVEELGNIPFLRPLISLKVMRSFSSFYIKYRKYDDEILDEKKHEFKIDTFFEPLLYTVPLEVANKHLKRKYTGKGEESFSLLNHKSEFFPNSDYKQSKIVYDQSGLQFLRIYFPSDRDNVRRVFEEVKAKCKEMYKFKFYTGFKPFHDRYELATASPKFGLRLKIELINSGSRGHYVALKASDDYKKLPDEEYDAKAKPEPARPVNPIVRMVPRQVPPATLSIMDMVKANDNIFNLKSNVFEKKYFNGFQTKWTDKFKTSSRSVSPINFFEFKSTETLFYFKQNQLKKLVLMIYNKGDQETPLRELEFSKLVHSLKSRINEFTGKDAIYKINAGLAKNYLYWWSTSDFLIKLESNYTKTSKDFSSEYIRISFSKPVRGLNNVNIDRTSIDTLTNQDLEERVIKDNDGSVYIAGVPMVDQGKKGYCACAATARLLNYYGREIDQHDIAKLANSDKLGTGIDDLQKALQIISSKLRLNIKQLAKCYLSNDRDFKRFMVKLEREFEKQDYQFGQTLNVKELKHVFSILAEKDRRYLVFKKSIIDSIDGGKPIAWALALGIVPEPEIPQAEGGHMRLIIGYNEKTEEIYYTDTWGAGHEKKSMDMKSAFWISSALLEIRPR